MVALPFRINNQVILGLSERSHSAVAAIDASGAILRYGELLSFSERIGSLLSARSLLFLLTGNNVGGIAWSMGCINSGNVPLILDAHIEEELYRNLFEIYRPSYVCLPTRMASALRYEIMCECYGYTLLHADMGPCTLHADLSHLLPTSGSTGNPKLVHRKYGNIEAAALNISTFFGLTSNDRPLLVLPLYCTMGLSVVFSHLYVGSTVLITNQSMTDKAFWNFMKEQRATSFTGVPYSFEILNLMRFFRMDLPGLTLLTQGGGKMSRQLDLKFAEYCHDNGKRWIATYGQSEGTAHMAYLPAEWAIEEVGSIGRAVPNAELSLIDSEGNRIEGTNTEGEMCYRDKNVTMGYARSREDLSLGDERNGFVRTGDLAYRNEDGCYYIVGRMGRFLKLFGMRIELDECGQIIKGRYPIEYTCVETNEKLTVYLTDGKYATEVKEVLVEKTRLVASAFKVRVIDEIPRNEAGKILYSKLNV